MMDEDHRQDTFYIQDAALKRAVDLHASRSPDSVIVIEEVLATADVFARWLGNPVSRLVIRPDTLTYTQPQFGGKAAGTVFRGGIVELKDSQQVSLSLDIHDVKGFDTAEPADTVMSWSSDNADVISLQPAADGLSCLAVAGVPGAAMVQVTDGTRTGSLAFDVTPGDVSAIAIQAGTPEEQPLGG